MNFQKQNIYQKTISKLEKREKIVGASNKLRTVSHCYNVPFLINKIIENFVQKNIEKGIFHEPGALLSEFDLLNKIATRKNFDDSLV